MAATPIIIDTDMGSDDVMAIAFLLSHRQIPVEAITVVNGLAHVPAGAANARRLVHAAGREDVQVFEGRETPLQRTDDFPRQWREKSDVRITDDAVHAPASRERGEAWLSRRLKEGSRPVRILALGPLTNVAIALDGANAKAVEEIVIMGGAFHVPGNLGDGGVFQTKNVTAEWNFFVDPEAAVRVFRSGVPVRVVPLDATSKVKLDAGFLSHFERQTRGPLAAIVRKVLEGEREFIRQGFYFAWDPLAATAMLEPDVCEWSTVRVGMRTGGDEAGRSLIEPGSANARVALDAHRDRFEKVFLGAFR